LYRDTNITVQPAGAGPDRVATTEYWPSGEKSRRIKADKVQETWFYANDGRLLRDRSHNDAAPTDKFAKDQEYRYDENGNRTKDERGEHQFNARGQLVEWKRGEQYEAPGSKVTYDVNGSGAITEKHDEGANDVTKYKYIGDRLKSTSSTRDGNADYTYDPFGNVKKIDGGSDDADFEYDAFERMTKSSGGTTDTTSEYEYDGMDRRDTETSDGKTQDFAYVGTSDQLSQERARTGGKTEDYDYDATDELVGRAEGQGGVETQGSYKDYGKDANGSVQGLEDKDGTIKPGNQYLYDPYGKIENEAEIAEKGNEATKDNPFRFESFYFDSGVKQYDMRARNYRPEIGRFTSQDRFESASKDFNLQADPLTQNRYAFAGGNPVNRVEFDGHFGFGDIKKAAGKVGGVAKDFGEGAWEGVKETANAVKDPVGTAKGMATLGTSFVKDPVGTSKQLAKSTAECFKTNAAKCAGKAAVALVGAKGVGAVGKAASVANKGGKATKAAGATAKGPSNRARGAAPDCNSFVPGTPVLMADGTSKPIEDVEVGDLVVATIEMTGQTGAFPVTDLIAGIGQKRFVRITADGHTTTATLKHPVWLADEARWIPAGSLSVGDRLLRTDGSEAVVEGAMQFTVLRARVHNLTIVTAHTYYAGADPVRVHNAGDCVKADGEGASAGDIKASTGGPGGGSRSGQAAMRRELIAESGGTFRCWRCGMESNDPRDMQLGHRNVPASKNGNLSRANCALEGAACNLSAGNRGKPKPGRDCRSRGGCGAPFKRILNLFR
jgi:RHS repeat-associated protein